ncbi:MAG: hypothetical protein ABI760_15245 [Ferruginibacter sp.]
MSTKTEYQKMLAGELNISPNVVAAGNPCRVIRQLPPVTAPNP